jgi:hypothetical protein
MERGAELLEVGLFAKIIGPSALACAGEAGSRSLPGPQVVA